MTSTARPDEQPGPGLDTMALHSLRQPRRDLEQLRARIEQHLDQHEGYVAFSGGKDSLVTLHLALQVDPELPVAFFDSGFEYPETYSYLADLTQAWRLNLQLIPARRTTLQILAATGTWDHHATRNSDVPALHQVLITEPAARAHETYGPGEIWGVRAEESRGRAAAYATALRAETTLSCHGCCTTQATRRAAHGGLIRRVAGTTAFGPVWDWKTAEIWQYLAHHEIPINPVYARLRALGAPEHFLRISHVLDAARLEQGRLTWLRRGWPALVEELALVLPRVRELI